MKFTTTRSDLLPSLLQVFGAIGRSTLPILDCLLLEINETGCLQLTATDMEIQIAARSPIQPELPGAVAAPARKLTDIVRLLPSGAEIAIEQSGEKLTVRSGRSRYSLATMPADAYPAFDRGETLHRLDLPASTLLTAIQKTRFAVAQGDVRFYLNGLAMQIEAGTLRTVASDGHRLALCELPVESGDITTSIVIAPSKGVDELARLLRDDVKAAPDRVVQLGIGENSYTVRIGHVECSSKLIEGQFPDYNRVLPRDAALTCRAPRDDFIAALQRVVLLAGSHFGVALDIGGESIAMTCANENGEQAEDSVTITALAGGPARQGYSARYLVDALGIFEGEDVVLKISSNGSCLLEDPATDHWRCVVMPVRL